jgi:hypothetical protein
MSKQQTALRPNKKLLVISSVTLVLWIGVLVWMYVKWVWPTRINGSPTTNLEQTE